MEKFYVFIIIMILIFTNLSNCVADKNCGRLIKENNLNYISDNCKSVAPSMLSCTFENAIVTYKISNDQLLHAKIIYIETLFEIVELHSDLLHFKDSSDNMWLCLKIKQGIIRYNYFESLNVFKVFKDDDADQKDKVLEISKLLSFINPRSVIRQSNRYYNLVIDFHGNSTVAVAKMNNTSACLSNHEYSKCNYEYVISPFVYGYSLHGNGINDIIDIQSEEFLLTHTYKDLQEPTINSFKLTSKQINDEFLLRTFGKSLALLNIATLDLSNSQIKSLNEELLPEMKTLKYFKLDSTMLNKIEPQTFRQTLYIEELHLSNNELEFMPNVSMLHNLRVLNLSRQNVPRFSLTPLQQLKSLIYFNVSHSNIASISRYVFLNWKELQIMDLSFCYLKNIEAGSFETMTSLKYLNLEGNFLTTLSSTLFLTLSSISDIILKNNSLSSNLNLEFLSVSKLDLSQNSIITPENLIAKGTIGNLDLSKNSVINWNSETVFKSDLHYIRKVNMSYNKIQTMHIENIKSTHNLESIDIGKNLFDCQADCSLKEFQNWINSSSYKILNLNSTRPLKCILPLGVNVVDAKYNETLCDIKSFNYVLASGVLISIIALLFLCMTLLLYVYRYEVTYLNHLLKIRKRNAKKSENSNSNYRYEYDVFISYSSKDRDWVFNILLPQLENPLQEYKVCLHERDFPLGSYIVQNLVSNVLHSRRVLLVLTPSYVESDWCKFQVKMAQYRIFTDKAEFLILIELKRLDVSQLPLHLRVLMESRTYLEWHADMTTRSHFWRRLKDALGSPLMSSQQEADEEFEFSVPDFLLG